MTALSLFFPVALFLIACHVIVVSLGNPIEAAHFSNQSKIKAQGESLSPLITIFPIFLMVVYIVFTLSSEMFALNLFLNLLSTGKEDIYSHNVNEEYRYGWLILIFCFFYVIRGGFRGVVKTDIFQMFVYVIFIIGVHFCLLDLHGYRPGFYYNLLIDHFQYGAQEFSVLIASIFLMVFWIPSSLDSWIRAKLLLRGQEGVARPAKSLNEKDRTVYEQYMKYLYTAIKPLDFIASNVGATLSIYIMIITVITICYGWGSIFLVAVIISVPLSFAIMYHALKTKFGETLHEKPSDITYIPVDSSTEIAAKVKSKPDEPEPNIRRIISPLIMSGLFIFVIVATSSLVGLTIRDAEINYIEGSESNLKLHKSLNNYYAINEKSLQNKSAAFPKREVHLVTSSDNTDGKTYYNPFSISEGEQGIERFNEFVNSAAFQVIIMVQYYLESGLSKYLAIFSLGIFAIGLTSAVITTIDSYLILFFQLLHSYLAKGIRFSFICVFSFIMLMLLINHMQGLGTYISYGIFAFVNISFLFFCMLTFTYFRRELFNEMMKLFSIAYVVSALVWFAHIAMIEGIVVSSQSGLISEILNQLKHRTNVLFVALSLLFLITGYGVFRNSIAKRPL